jgi:branched-chain amino acid transport system ATP-binding protein
MTAPLLSARGLYLAFGGLRAADGIDLDVMPGEFLAIIGPNGAGKTTFINMATGWLLPQAGSIRFAGRELVGRRPREIVRLGIARSFQLPQLFTELAVVENVALILAARDGWFRPLQRLLAPSRRDEAMAILGRFGLEAIAGARATTLNEGSRKLVDIAMAVALRPQLLLMDEPTSGVATAEKLPLIERLAQALRGEGVTAVFVEHDMDIVARFADRVAVWNQGRIAALGTPRDILTHPDVLRDVIGIEAHAAA